MKEATSKPISIFPIIGQVGETFLRAEGPLYIHGG